MSTLSQIKTRKPKRNRFDLSHEKLLTCQMGALVPNFIQEVVPGDQFRINTETLVRLAPMLAPVMHRIDVHQHYFYVPNRILWTEWEDFITGGEDGTDLPSFPRMSLGNGNLNALSQRALLDYLGIPPVEINTAIYVSALPFRAYQTIYNEYYRDQNLIDEVEVKTGSGIFNGDADFWNLFPLRYRAWEKDYFTNALPFTQRGPEVELPLGSLNIEYLDQAKIINSTTLNQGGVAGNLLSSDNEATVSNLTNANSQVLGIENIDEVATQIDSVTINNLRQAVRLQEFMELSARAGSRYVEQIQAHFGVRVQDFRLQRPEYLGGGKSPVMISEVLTQAHGTDSSNTDIPVGEMYGHGLSVSNASGCFKSVDEHGFIIGIMSIMPRTNYYQGLNKFWKKFDKFDYYFPTFANLGEQEVKNYEIYLQDNEEENEGLFGYQQRYAEYKYAFGGVHGDFRTNLDFWHLGRKFSALPVLNGNFVTCQLSETQRIFTNEDTNSHKCWVQLYHKVDAFRPMPYFSIPTL